MQRRIVKVKVVVLDERKVFLNFREEPGGSPACRYSVEICFDSRDRAVLDGPTLSSVEEAAEACLHATWASRRLIGATNVASSVGRSA